MKFGKNLQELSIPEWKAHNLDYNELKGIIKELNNTNSSDLRFLYNSFLENFTSINLFVNIKYGEISRKLQFYQNNAGSLMERGKDYSPLGVSMNGDSYSKNSHDNGTQNGSTQNGSTQNGSTHGSTHGSTQNGSNNDGNNEEIRQIKLEILLSNLIDLSIVLKKLSKFILIQKIACKKIFKKFLKYYFNKEASTKMIMKLKLKLNKDTKSFINLNLHTLTIDLTNLINLVKFEIKNDITPSPEGPSSMSEYLTSINNLNLPDSLKFDLNCLIKKNFDLSFVIPDDTNNLNEIFLNLNIYLNLKPISVITRNSFIFLQSDDNLMSHPSYIITEHNQPNSLIISYIGGLRKFSYCSLPNEIVNTLLSYLGDLDNLQLKEKLKKYFHTSNINSLTKLTIESILNNGLKPKARSFYKMTRYYLSKLDDELDEEFSTIPEDDYLIQLLSDISTSIDSKYLNSISFPPEYPRAPNSTNENQQDNNDANEHDDDNFPFNILYLYSNDSNLLEFNKNLLSEVQENLLLSKYSQTSFNKLPVKIQKIVKNTNSINLFQGFNFYEYCLSCYYNSIPNNLNNHYSNLLSLNLFKTFENTETFHKDLSYHNSLLKLNEDKKLKNQISLNDLESRHDSEPRPKIQFDLEPSINTQGKRPRIRKNDSIQTLSSFNASVFTDKLTNNDELDEIIDYEDNESLQMFWKDSDNPYNSYKRPYTNNPYAYYNSLDENQDKGRSSQKLGFSNLIDNLIGFQKIPFNDQSDASSVLLENYYDRYNRFIAFFYFTLTFVAIFICGVELGIIFSIIQIDDGRSVLLSNLWLLFVLIVGIVISFISSLISLNLIFKRVSRPPSWHYVLLFLGFGLVIICGLLVLILSVM